MDDHDSANRASFFPRSSSSLSYTNEYLTKDNFSYFFLKFPRYS